MMELLKQILICCPAAALGAVGFAVVFRVRGRALLPGALLGGFGYLPYLIGMHLSLGPVVSSLLGSALVGFCGEIAARRMKMPALVLTTMGAIPLVPGYGLYQTMLYFVEGENQLALAKGVETLLVAGAIAVALGICAAAGRYFGRRMRRREGGDGHGENENENKKD